MSQSPKCITVPGFVQVSSSPSTWLLDHHVPTPSRPHSHHLAGSCMEPKHHSPAGRSPSWETQASHTEVIQKSYNGTSWNICRNGREWLATFGYFWDISMRTYSTRTWYASMKNNENLKTWNTMNCWRTWDLKEPQASESGQLTRLGYSTIKQPHIGCTVAVPLFTGSSPVSLQDLQAFKIFKAGSHRI